MAGLLQNITYPDNLFWAWRKVKYLYETSHDWYDEAEVARFEMNLEQELRSIETDLKAGKYNPYPIVPIGSPKAPKDGNLRLRSSFLVHVRDQVAWVAFINVIGPELDEQMPAWSYGYRLYRPAWYERTRRRRVFRIGSYRPGADYLYTPFPKAWPRYRRHLYKTLTRMTRGTRARPVQGDISENASIPKVAPEYLRRSYWPPYDGDLHWGAIDFENFYPSLPLAAVREGILKHSSFEQSELEFVLLQLLEFRIDYSDVSDFEVENLGLSERPTHYKSLPVGFFAAGFLANVAMLSIDKEVDARLRITRDVAHFRYVDDHTFLARGYDRLVSWIQEYEALVKKFEIGIKINVDKTKPEHLAAVLNATEVEEARRSLEEAKARAESYLDPLFPTPLMTTTLGRVSAAKFVDFDLLDEGAQLREINNMEDLLVAPLPDQELQTATRVTFAATMLGSFGRRFTPNVFEETILEREIADLQLRIKKAASEIHDSNLAHSNAEQDELIRELRSEELTLGRLRAKSNRQIANVRRRILDLLQRALRAHPDKLRLWSRTLDFSYYSDIDSSVVLQGEIRRLSNQNALAAAYINASLMEHTARLVLKAFKSAIQESEIPTRRQASLNFLLRASENPPFLILNSDTYLERRSFNIYQCAIATCVLSLSNSDVDDCKVTADRINVFARRSGVILWTDEIHTWAAQTNISLAAWLWWAELNTVEEFSTEPGLVYQHAATKLLTSDRLSWRLFRLYPRHLPKDARQMLIGGTAPIGNDIGWICDALRKFTRTLPAGGDVLVDEAYRALAVEKDHSSFYEWAQFCQRLSAKVPGDPRVSEWTCLELVSQAIESYTERKEDLQIGDTVHLGPLAFYLPLSLMNDEDSFDWIKWSMTVRREVEPRQEGQTTTRSVRLRLDGMIFDSRFSPGWPGGGPMESSWSEVQSFALILIGLLWQSFDWPALWNVYGQERSWLSYARFRSGALSCSTYTSSILAACLAPRAKERGFLSQLQVSQGANVTWEEGLTISNRIDLLSYLRLAQIELQKLQVSVEMNKPRQLIPVHLGQMASNPWSQIAIPHEEQESP